MTIKCGILGGTTIMRAGRATQIMRIVLMAKGDSDYEGGTEDGDVVIASWYVTAGIPLEVEKEQSLSPPSRL